MPDGKPLPPGEVGEIATRSGSNMVGYWNLPEATARTLGGDGWLRTGDAGYMDADGYLYIHDRIKDMIISGGENIYPGRGRSAICDHPARRRGRRDRRALTTNGAKRSRRSW